MQSKMNGSHKMNGSQNVNNLFDSLFKFIYLQLVS